MQARGELVAVDPELHEVLWARSAPHGGSWTTWRPFVRGDHVLAGTGQGGLWKLDLEDGTPESIPFSMEGVVRVFTDDAGTLLVGTTRGELVALR
jgi:outer membrane protein assembly factor BamB